MGDGDIRDELRRDHVSFMARLEILRVEPDSQRCLDLLEKVRRSWLVHALAEETVVYRSLESAEAAPEGGAAADERLVEDELIDVSLEKVGKSHPGTSEWFARLKVAKALIQRHIAAEHSDLFPKLERQFDDAVRKDMARNFATAKEKLTVLEEAKARP